MPVQIKLKEKTIFVFIKGEIDHHTAPKMREMIDDAIIVNDSFQRVVIDFSGVSFMDSSGIGLVMGRYRLAQQKGKIVEVVGLNARYYKIMKMSGIEKLMTIRSSENKKEW